jgi:hypothetical protein
VLSYSHWLAWSRQYLAALVTPTLRFKVSWAVQTAQVHVLERHDEAEVKTIEVLNYFLATYPSFPVVPTFQRFGKFAMSQETRAGEKLVVGRKSSTPYRADMLRKSRIEYPIWP